MFHNKRDLLINIQLHQSERVGDLPELVVEHVELYAACDAAKDVYARSFFLEVLEPRLVARLGIDGVEDVPCLLPCPSPLFIPQ